LNLYFILFISL